MYESSTTPKDTFGPYGNFTIRRTDKHIKHCLLVHLAWKFIYYNPFLEVTKERETEHEMWQLL